MKCHLCGEQTERPETMAEHLRLMHPDDYDESLEPSDFTDPDGAA